MKKHSVIYLSVFLAALLSVLAGCGKEKATSGTAQQEFVYVPEFISLEGETGGSGEDIAVIGDSVYYISSEYDKSSQTDVSYLCAWNSGVTEPVKTLLYSGKGATFSNLSVSSDGNLQAILSTGPDDNADEEGQAEPVSQKMEYCRIGTDGKIISTLELTDSFAEMESANVRHLQTDGEGNIYINTGQSIIVLGGNGKQLFEIVPDNWINYMFSTKDGTVLASFYGMQDMEIHSIDIQKKGFGENNAGMLVSVYDDYMFAKGYDTDLLFSVGNKLYSYNLAEGAAAEILDWMDCGINPHNLRAFSALSDGRILAVTSQGTGESSETEVVYLTMKESSEAPEKKILTYVTNGLSNNKKQQIADFNRKSGEYHIEIKDYLSDDLETGWTQLNADIVSGKSMDIIDIPRSDFNQYARKGMMEDLYSFLDKDSELSREDYLENVLNAFETDGKLYGLCPKYYITTVLAKQSIVGDRKSMTIEELMNLAKNLPEGTQLYEYVTKMAAVMNNIMMNMDRYVDWSTGKCSFNSDSFINILEFANTFDTEYNTSGSNPDTAKMLEDNSLIMVPSFINSVQKYQMWKKIFAEPIAFIGYPTDGDSGSFISDGGSTTGISVKSENKEGAWQFVRSLITREAQEELAEYGDGFPIMKSALELLFQKDMTEEYEEMPDGTKEKKPKTDYGYAGLHIDIYAATEDEVAIVRDLIYSVDKPYEYDDEIGNIITEESQAFFEGQKTAKDVADIIQNRVQIYVDENRQKN